VSAFIPNPDFTVIWLRDSAQGVILNDVGLGRPASQATTFDEGGYTEGGADYGWVQISTESLDLAKADEIFMFTWADPDPANAAAMRQALEDFAANDALWQAVQGDDPGNVHIVGAHWYRAQTYLAANLILDDLFAALTDVEPTITSPAAPYVTVEGA
jgi:ABC-type Fe3+-hydroxamate transport system substrate-binding protein